MKKLVLLTVFFTAIPLRATDTSPTKQSQTESFLRYVTREEILNNINVDIAKYSDLFKNIIQKEKEYSDTHFALYHAERLDVYLVQLLLTELACHFEGQQRCSDYLKLRVNEQLYKEEHTASEFLEKHKDAVNDNIEPYRSWLLSTNFVLGGNKYHGESSLSYYAANRSIASSEKIAKLYLEALKPYCHTLTQHQQEIINTVAQQHFAKLNDLFASCTDGVILQILLPKTIIDQAVYPSSAGGLPIQEISPTSCYNDKLNCCDKVSPLLNQMQANCSLFSKEDLFQQQARIILKQSLFGAPHKDIKIIVYNPLSQEVELQLRNEIRLFVIECLTKQDLLSDIISSQNSVQNFAKNCLKLAKTQLQSHSPMQNIQNSLLNSAINLLRSLPLQELLSSQLLYHPLNIVIEERYKAVKDIFKTVSPEIALPYIAQTQKHRTASQSIFGSEIHLLSNNGNHIAFKNVSDTSPIIVSESTTGKVVQTIKADNFEGPAAWLCKDTYLLVRNMHNRTCRIISLATGETTFHFPCKNMSMPVAIISNDGSALVAKLDDGLHYWNLSTNEHHFLALTCDLLSEAVLDISSNNTYVAATIVNPPTSSKAILWHPQKNTVLWKKEEKSIISNCAFNTTGTKLALCSVHDKKTDIVDTLTGTPIESYFTENPPFKVFWNKTDTQLAISTIAIGFDGITVSTKFIDLQKKNACTLKNCSHIAWINNNQIIGTSMFDGTVTTYRLSPTGQALPLHKWFSLFAKEKRAELFNQQPELFVLSKL